MKINIKKLYEDAVIPTSGSAQAAGLDLYAYTEGKDKIDIYPFDTVKIKTGIAAAIPPGHFGAIFARSGIATKRGLRPANCVGVIDADYRGEIIVALHNDTDVLQHVVANERIAQLVIIPYAKASLNVVEDLDETERGDGGFGSTGEGLVGEIPAARIYTEDASKLIKALNELGIATQNCKEESARGKMPDPRNGGPDDTDPDQITFF